jgi:hypothetical protein
MIKYGAAASQLSKTAEGRGDAEKCALAIPERNPDPRKQDERTTVVVKNLRKQV